MKEYDKDFYQSRHLNTTHSASKIFSILLNKIPQINSAVDFGCGVGTWLCILKEKGISEIQGYDGPWVDINLLTIPKENFEAVDLFKKITLNKKYDLAISLEVAEHLPDSFANEFVETLIESSHFILFSAAIPYQGGNHHFNEQWPEYWVAKFKERGFVAYDFIRPQIFNDPQIPFWYKQNILFFAKKDKAHLVKETPTESVVSFVHPDLYLKKVAALNVGIKGSFQLLMKAIKNYFFH